MTTSVDFKWQHYEPELLLLAVRWYLRYSLSYRDLGEMMEERGLSIAHTTIMRWVHRYGPELDKRVRCHLKKTNDSWRFDETYIKVKGEWMYLYRAVDCEGNTVDFYLSKNRKATSTKRFFKQALVSCHTSKPRVLTIDKNPSYPKAVKQSQKEENLPSGIQLQKIKYLNNMIEQDHRFIKKRIRYILGFQSLQAASTTLAHMIKKRQTFQGKKSVRNQIQLINTLFGLIP
ncbi:IS6 family transposase [Bacillus cereus]|uniref:IS6 family transposase n=1 Tax=Bacillus cereus TaxID=1396 RepID=UPI002481642F|nr:IS6 family transposase [Bacillus cereus]MDH8001268.1 IS6 family transposase [Bacillus cereus]